MYKYTLPLVLALSAFSSNSNADALGLFVGAGVWDHDASGTFGTDGDTNIDVESDLNYSSDKDTYIWAAFEHFVPLVPNVRVEAASIGHSGTATTLVSFNGNPVVSGDSSINLDTIDTILYYRLLDNWVNVDFGFNFRNLSGDFTIGNETASVSATVPMLYASAQFDLPFSGFSVGGDMSLTSYSGSTYQDLRLRAMYEMGVIGIEAGLRTTTIELDDIDNVNADLEFTGLMIGAFLHF